MPAKKPLRAVASDEKAPPAVPKTITQAAKAGTHLELLVAMRDRIAEAVQDVKCPPRDLAALTRRLHEIATEIARMEASEAQEGGSNGPAEDEEFDADAI